MGTKSGIPLMVFFLCFLVLNLHLDAQPFKNWEKAYFPRGVEKISFGMSYDDLRKKRKNTQTSRDSNDSFRFILQEQVDEQEFIDLIYYVDKDGEKPLYEVLVVYPIGTDVREVAEELYGAPNQGEEWWFEHPNGYPINIWVYEQKLVIAAVLPDTEWDED